MANNRGFLGANNAPNPFTTKQQIRISPQGQVSIETQSPPKRYVSTAPSPFGGSPNTQVGMTPINARGSAPYTAAIPTNRQDLPPSHYQAIPQQQVRPRFRPGQNLSGMPLQSDERPIQQDHSAGMHLLRSRAFNGANQLPGPQLPSMERYYQTPPSNMLHAPSHNTPRSSFANMTYASSSPFSGTNTAAPYQTRPTAPLAAQGFPALYPQTVMPPIEQPYLPGNGFPFTDADLNEMFSNLNPQMPGSHAPLYANVQQNPRYDTSDSNFAGVPVPNLQVPRLASSGVPPAMRRGPVPPRMPQGTSRSSRTQDTDILRGVQNSSVRKNVPAKQPRHEATRAQNALLLQAIPFSPVSRASPKAASMNGADMSGRSPFLSRPATPSAPSLPSVADTCPHCPAGSTPMPIGNFASFAQHLRKYHNKAKKHPNEPMKCHWCSSKFSTIYDYVRHLETVQHDNFPEVLKAQHKATITCDTCFRTFARQDSLTLHQRTGRCELAYDYKTRRFRKG